LRRRNLLDGGQLAERLVVLILRPLQIIFAELIRWIDLQGVWNQYIQKLDASLMKAGDNTVTFTVPAGDVTSGVVWDYVRLELNDGSKTYPTPPDHQRPDYPTMD
jgi:hypothetical protein